MMNETIATLANTTIQEVLNDERIKRLVLDIIQAKHQDTTSPSLPASSSTFDNTIFNRKTSRVAEYKKIYLQETSSKENKKNYCVITNVNKAVIETTPYEDLSMVLFLTTFSSLNDMCAFLTYLSEEEQLCQKAFILKTIATHWKINKHGPLDLPPDLNVELFHYNLYLGP